MCHRGQADRQNSALVNQLIEYELINAQVGQAKISIKEKHLFFCLYHLHTFVISVMTYLLRGLPAVLQSLILVIY